MGQGTESCGGYEVDYDPYEGALERGCWITKEGREIAFKDMTLRHLHGAKQVAIRAKMISTFTDEREKWSDYIDALDSEIDDRRRVTPRQPIQPRPIPSNSRKVPRGATKQMICWCGVEYTARVADLNRGLYKSCCKSHAAIRREYGKPAAKEKK